MPAEFIRQRERVRIEEYRRSFKYCGPDASKRGCGYAFDSDREGNVDLSTLTLLQRVSWDLAHSGEYVDEGVLDYSRWYWEPAAIRCACGRECVLDGSENDCDCGRIYNNFGQEYRPREEWADAMEAAGERWDDDY